MFDKEKFKNAVNLTMIEKGLSQAKLSKEIGVEGASLSLVMNDKRGLTALMVKKFCDASEGRYTPEDFIAPQIQQTNVNGGNVNGNNVTIKKVSGDEVHIDDMTNTKLYNDMLLVIKNMASELSEVHKEMKNYYKYIDRCLNNIDELKDERNSLRKEIEVYKNEKAN